MMREARRGAAQQQPEPEVQMGQPEVPVVPVNVPAPEVVIPAPEVVIPAQQQDVPVPALGAGINGNVVNNNLVNQANFDMLPSIHAEVGIHVSAALKNKVIAGQYVELSLLLDQNCSEQNRRVIELNSSGELVFKPAQSSRTITSIETWTDAFLVYASIFLAAHPFRTQEILKYMNVIRTAATRHQGQGWLRYDIQFRLRLAIDPTNISFANIDYELWLLFMNAPTCQMEGYLKQNSRKCYNYNFRQCFNLNCIYRHVCMNCGQLHPSKSCSNNRAPQYSFRASRPYRAPAVAQGPRWVQPQSRFSIRNRFNFPTSK